MDNSLNKLARETWHSPFIEWYLKRKTKNYFKNIKYFKDSETDVIK